MTGYVSTASDLECFSAQMELTGSVNFLDLEMSDAFLEYNSN